MVTKYLVQNKPGPILAIDADPSSNLNMVLGLDLDWTVGDIREDMLAQVKSSLVAGGAAMGALPGGMSKHDYLDHKIRSSLAEGVAFDLIAMGRSEGTGCYCAVNHNLREVIDSISKNYKYIVIDNEAGMEHLSRRTTRDAERIASFRNELDIRIERAYLIINRLTGPLPPALKTEIDKLGIPLLGTVSADDELSKFEFSGIPLVELGNDSQVYQAVARMMDEIL
jgi:CO dehydrogenase maturation factor